MLNEIPMMVVIAKLLELSWKEMSKYEVTYPSWVKSYQVPNDLFYIFQWSFESIFNG